MQRLEDKGVTINARPENDGSGSILSILLSWLPMILILGVWIFFMRQMQSGSGRAMGFGKSKAKLLTEAHGRVTFQDVAGVDEAKEDLEEIVEFLRDPQKFQRLGGKIPRGVLLVGPPEPARRCWRVPLPAKRMFRSSPFPARTSSRCSWVSARRRVRDMFDQAKKNAPCIIFIDEIDAVGRHRGAGLGGGNDEREQTLNQLLVEMDGFEANEGIILIAATNRPDVLDPALLRPGRFDRQVVVPNPDINGREKILKVHVRNVPLAPNVDLKVIARGTPGFSGADLANLVNEAALMAARRNKRLVTMQEFEDAKDKVMMGAERRSTAMTLAEKELTAYHEAGHAILALNVPSADPLHKATIIPRGRSLGMVMQLPEGDRYSMSYKYMISRLAIMMGGRVAEEIQVRQGEHHLRRFLRYRSGDQAGARHGDALGLFRQARSGRLWREPGRGLPWPFGGPAAERFGRDGADYRRRGTPADRGGLFDSPADPDQKEEGMDRAGRRSAGIRDAFRRRDQATARRP